MPGNVEHSPEREPGCPCGRNAVDTVAPFVWWGLEAVALYLDGTQHEGPSAVAKALVMVGQMAVILLRTSAR
jgi:hypothetical protein